VDIKNQLDPPQAQIDSVIELYSNGQIQEALDTAGALIKDYPNEAILYNISGACYAILGQLDTAVKRYEKALEIKPDYADAHNNLAITFQELGQLDAAVKCYDQALAIKPDYAEAFNNLGIVLKELGQLDTAVKSYEKILTIRPDFAEAHYNLGVTLQGLGQLDEAVKSYEQAIAIKPDYAEASNNLGIVLKELGQLDKAVKCYEKALSIESDNNFLWSSFSKNLRSIEFLEFNDSTASCLLQALKKPTVKPNDLLKPITSILRHNPIFLSVFDVYKSGNVDGKLGYLTEQLSTIPLLLKLMELCSIPDPEVEKLLTQIRFSTLNQLSNEYITSSSLPFYEALALHCFTNEYVFQESNEETVKVNQLENEISMHISSKELIPILKITVLAAYRPLHLFSWADQLLQSNSTDKIQRILTTQITEVREEQCLRSQIPEINVTENKVSKLVREQYEANPYPRWINLGLSPEPQTIRAVMHGLKVNLDLNEHQFPANPEILIAGCGTGQHALSVASRFQNSSVIAIDLSLSSLSYAVRKTKELSVANIDYMQGDILKLNTLDRQFDIIESAGVLHHMEDPLAGWKVLVDLLKPQGLMRIGLYSEIARQHIVEIREFIAKKGYENSPEGIRQCRYEIINMHTGSGSRIQQIINSPDFYSLSDCRDLLFHVQEHRFTLPQIANALEKLGLIFIGFDCSTQIQNQFKARYSNNEDLASLPLWHQFEQDNPNTFFNMYQFWVQKYNY